MGMSQVHEITPTHCPACGVDWTPEGAMLRGWGYSPIVDERGGRTWTCVACGEITRPESVELRPN